MLISLHELKFLSVIVLAFFQITNNPNDSGLKFMQYGLIASMSLKAGKGDHPHLFV